MKVGYLITILVLLVLVLIFAYYASFKQPKEEELVLEDIEEFVVEEEGEVQENDVTRATPYQQPKEVVIEIKGLSFIPSDINITKGTKVVWVNNDNGPHEVYAAIPGTPFFSGRLESGSSYSYTFNDLGVYKYRDGIHKFMKGTITVIEKEDIAITGSFIGARDEGSIGMLMVFILVIMLGILFDMHEKNK
ncbi:cupredoxin domain-containing protein [Candidatus Woesearchaeota archaeon]|nr:cupredoxin domain-containing protein [Candidatus Woesearchaeota archaeon]